MNDQKPVSDKSLADALSMGNAGKNPETAARAAKYLDEQIAHLQREASLHDLHVENLKLQSAALRAQQMAAKDQHEHIVLQKKQLRAQRLHERLRTVYQGVLSLIALAVLGLIGYALYSAATDQSVVVNQFQVPPDMAAQGNNGTVVASEFLDQLQSLQAASRGSQASRVLEDAWSNNIQLQVPDVHVSLGDIRRTLHAWLGHEIQINGSVVQQGNQTTPGSPGNGIALTVRGTGLAAKTFNGNPADLPKLLTAAADYVYGQAEPYLFAVYLEINDRDADAITLVKAAWPTASSTEKPWLLNSWGNALTDLNQYAAASDKYEQAIRLDPHFWIAYTNVVANDILLGREEQAYQIGVREEHAARRGTWFAAQMPEANYEYLDQLRMELSAVHRELVADEAAHGGIGSNVAPDPPLDAEMLARMHADKQAELILQTTPGAGSDPYIMAETAFVQGIMALDRQDYTQAAAGFQTTDTLLVQNPTQQSNFTVPTVCYAGLALELSGQSAQADAAMAKGGHFVDCYRFKADIADHRGDWAQAQKDYQAAVNLAPSLPMAYDSWGLALMRHGDYKDAIVKFEAANHRGLLWCDPLEHWGQALDKLGRHSEAQQHYQVAQEHGESLTVTEHATLAKLLSG